MQRIDTPFGTTIEIDALPFEAADDRDVQGAGCVECGSLDGIPLCDRCLDARWAFTPATPLAALNNDLLAF